MIQLKEVIQYYIGRTFWTPNSQVEVNVHTLPYILDMLKRGIKVRLHLRRLEDADNDDLIKMIKQFTRFDLSECEFEVETKEGKWVNAIKDGRVIEALEIADNGNYINSLNDDDDMGIITPQWEVFHYLLKQGFDLFSLIDNGFAVDAKTLNQKA